MEENAKSRAVGEELARSVLKPLAGETYFFGIAINKYQDWPNLNNAVRDVKDVVQLLQDKYLLKPDNVELLFNEQATRGNIFASFEDFKSKVKTEDSLLIYYAGHGHLDKYKRGHWIPHDAVQGKKDSYIRDSAVIDDVEDVDSLHTLLISDSCFSGSLLDVGNKRKGSGDAADELAKLRSRWVISSGRDDEAVSDGPVNGNSPFAKSIINYLSVSERDKILASQLLDNIRESTYAKSNQLPLGGPMRISQHDGGQYVFCIQEGKESDKLWRRIQLAPDDTLAQIRAKKDLIRKFDDNFSDDENHSEALDLAEYLEHKRDVLEAFRSEFKLRRLLKDGDTPFRAEIEERIKQLQEGKKESPSNEGHYHDHRKKSGLGLNSDTTGEKKKSSWSKWLFWLFFSVLTIASADLHLLAPGLIMITTIIILIIRWVKKRKNQRLD